MNVFINPFPIEHDIVSCCYVTLQHQRNCIIGSIFSLICNWPIWYFLIKVQYQPQQQQARPQAKKPQLTQQQEEESQEDYEVTKICSNLETVAIVIERLFLVSLDLYERQDHCFKVFAILNGFKFHFQSYFPLVLRNPCN